MLPVHLLPFAGLLALIVAWPRLSMPTSHVELFVDVLIIGAGASAARAAAWEADKWIEHRW